MAKNQVERYEQILASDPSSTVFVELAKALLDRGEPGKAIDVCQQGLLHHNTSVVGRVLWGKALIHLGRPAEAMEQFDRAVTIDRDNPHAYNLISEVLLQKSLYRSALPLLRKAAALQPNDARIKNWLEQTQGALSGGPAPTLNDTSLMDAEVASAAQAAQAEQQRKAETLVTDPNVAALSPTVQGQGGPPGSGGSGAGGWDLGVQATLPNVRALGGEDRTELHQAFVPTSDDASGSHASASPDEDATLRGDQLRPAYFLPPDGVGSPPVLQPTVPRQLGNEVPGWDDPLDTQAERRPPQNEPLGGGPEDMSALAGAGAPADDPAATAPAPAAAPARNSLLDDIPEAAEFQHSGVLEIPKVELSPAAAEAIAKEYERELREKLAAKAEEKTFFQRFSTAIYFLIFLLLVGGAAGGTYYYFHHKHNGLDLVDALANAKKAFVTDTAAGYRQGLDSLGLAVSMDSSNEDAWALSAYAHAILYAEHGRAPEEKSQAESALAQANVESRFAGLALVSRYYLASDEEKDKLAQAVLDAELKQTEVQELAGRILLQKKDTKKAVARFRRALELASSNVRALVALGDYYRTEGDDTQALTFYDTAAQLSPQHLPRAVGAAEAHLALDDDSAGALKDLESIPASEEASNELSVRRELAQGRLLALTGKAKDAVSRLQAADAKYPGHAYEFAVARAEAQRLAGEMAAAQQTYEIALKLTPDGEGAREGLARTLLAEDKEHELLQRFQPKESEKRLWLVRGAAYVALGDWKKARSELEKTRVGPKLPLESVVYLALADAGEGQAEKAQQLLEKAQNSIKHPSSVLADALGQIYWQRGLTQKARAQFQEAAKDPRDYEASCALGRMHLAAGELDKAVESLEAAVARNGAHAEARHALTRAYLLTGRNEDALKETQEWSRADPSSGLAARDQAFALYLLGRAAEADAPSKKAIAVAAEDAESHRVRAAVLFARGDGKGAFSELERANKLNPKDAETFCAIGRAFLRQANGDHASKAYEAAVREQPSSVCGKVGVVASKLPAAPRTAAKELGELSQNAAQPWDRAGAASVLARVQLSSSPKEAKKTAERAVQLGPNVADAFYARGLAEQRGRDEAHARDDFAKASALDPTDGPIRLAYADALAHTDNGLAEAITQYQVFLKLSGKPQEMARVKKLLPALQKRMAKR